MMISIGANRNKKAYGIKHYNLDTESDLQLINTDREAMGTTAFVIETSQHYMINGSKQWKKISTSTGGGSNDEIYDGGGVEGPEDVYDGGGVGGPSDDNTYEGGGV
jgi:hypothetical protein